MKKSLLLCVLMLPLAIFADIKIVCSPYLQSLGEESVDIVWTTDKASISWVEIIPDNGKSFYNAPHTKYFAQKFGRKTIGKQHVVHISGLKKNTTYCYRVFSQEVTHQDEYSILYGAIAATNVYRKKPLKFTTLNPDKKEIHFSMVNDIHGRDSIFRRLLNNIPNNNCDFVIFNGDMTSSFSSENQILEGYLSSASELFASEIPFYFVRGNHEQRGLMTSDYLNYFPTNSGKPYYSFRQGPAFFLVLDGGEDKPDNDIEYNGIADFSSYRKEEAQWLKQQVESEAFRNAPYRIILIHMPPARDDNDWYGVTELRELFIPILQNKDVNLMLCGHEHHLSIFNEKESSFGFPLVINSNNTRLDVSVDKSGIEVNAIDTEGKSVGKLSVKHSSTY